MDAKDITLNTRRGLLIDGSWLSSIVNQRPGHLAQVFLENKLCVPPDTEFLAQGRIRYMETSYHGMAVVEPYSADSRDFMIARALIDCSKEVIPICLVNLSTHNVYFHSKYLLGEIHPVNAVTNLDNHIEEYNSSECRTSGYQVLRVEQTEDSDLCQSQLPEHLQDLYKRRLINIKLETHKNELASLLHQQQDVFAKHRTDLGTCSVLKHHIDTNGAAPIRQALRRTPRAFEQEEEKYLKEQLDASVLVPLSSAWASPACLVRKKDGTVHWCCDFRKLNDLTVKDAYPLPCIDMCLEALGFTSFL